MQGGDPKIGYHKAYGLWKRDIYTHLGTDNIIEVIWEFGLCFGAKGYIGKVAVRALYEFEFSFRWF